MIEGLKFSSLFVQGHVDVKHDPRQASIFILRTTKGHVFVLNIFHTPFTKCQSIINMDESLKSLNL